MATKPHDTATAAEITELCRLANRASAAAKYIKEGTPVARIRVELVRTAFRPVCDAVAEQARAAGLGDYADHIALRATSIEDGAARIAQAQEINFLCSNIARRPDDAKAHILAGASLATVRHALMTAMAEEDVHVDSARPLPVSGLANVYAQRKKGAK